MLKAPEHQVAGHFVAAGQLGPVVDGRGLFFKPLQSTDRGSNEVNFYSSFSSDPRVPSSIRLRFFPSFHGTQLLPHPSVDGPHHHPHLVLEDLTADLSNPSIIDLKIGSRTWAPSHTQDYVDKCIKKDRESTSLALGFRVSGLQILRQNGGRWKPSRAEIKKYTTTDDVRRVLRQFVSEGGGDGGLDIALASEVYGGSDGVLAQLLELKSWFEDQTTYHFYSTSVMVMYEKGKGKARVKLVDFAHAEEGDGVIDHNFLGGLCSLIKFISEVLTDPAEGAKKKENGE